MFIKIVLSQCGLSVNCVCVRDVAGHFLPGRLSKLMIGIGISTLLIILKKKLIFLKSG